MERSNQQTEDIPSSKRATAMRAGVQNPSGSNYQVAGPTIGGTATPYNPDNIEAAKEHLSDSFATKASINDTPSATTNDTPSATINDTPSATDSTLKDTVVSGASTAAHTAVDVTKTVAAGAAAAGAATVTAVKSLFADKGTHAAGTTDTTKINPVTTSKAQPIADFPHVSF